MTRRLLPLFLIAISASLIYGCQSETGLPRADIPARSIAPTDNPLTAVTATITTEFTPMLPTETALQDSAVLTSSIPKKLVSAPTDVLFISGVIEKGGKTGRLSPAYRLRALPVTGTGVGSYALDLMGPAGAIILHHPFDPVPILADSSGSAAPAGLSGFSFNLLAGDVRSIRLMHGSDLLDELSPGPSAPQVRLTLPDKQSRSISNDRLHVRWEASDPDGDVLTYMVCYSPDGGQVWQILAVNLTSTFADLDLAPMGATQQGLVQVLATDGVNTAADTFGPIIIGNKPPTVTIISPLNQAEMAVRQPILLIGSGQDPEDGTLPDEALVWISDQSGKLGVGQTVQVDAGLPAGDHIITLTGIDHSGNRSSQSVTIRVR